MTSSRFGTPQERAAAIAMEALNRGLWTQVTALAFVAQVDDEERLGFWETQLVDLIDLEDEAIKAADRVTEAIDQAEIAYDRLREQQNRLREVGEVEVATGIVTTGRTAMFGIPRRVDALLGYIDTED